jgi:hypothetical protein
MRLSRSNSNILTPRYSVDADAITRARNAADTAREATQAAKRNAEELEMK